jgi:predicted N-formylglutamate amidohydrolase
MILYSSLWDEKALEGSVFRLLESDEPAAVEVVREEGLSPFFFTCDHAGRRLPRRLGDLGLPESELVRHIAWDIGAVAVAHALAEHFDACLITQAYSRLVIDCNRPTHVPSSIPTISEETVIPGNHGLDPAEITARRREIFDVYHGAIEAALDAREARGQPTVLVSVHSFTPVFKGFHRPWDLGLLYHRYDRLASWLKDRLDADGDLVVGDNEPYAVSDTTDYTIPVYGEHRGIPHIMFEIRQDLIAEPPGQKAWADRLSDLLRPVPNRLAAQGEL